MPGLRLNPSRCCCGASCPISFSASGCNVLAPVEGATIKVWSDQNKTLLLASGVTSGSPPRVILDVGGATTVWVEAIHHRFNTVFVQRSVPSCGQGISVPFSGPAPGYHCDSFGLPWKDTLYYTNSRTGFSVVLNWDAAYNGWVGDGSLETLEYVFPDGNCPSLTVPYKAQFDTVWTSYQVLLPSYANIWKESWKADATVYRCPDGGVAPDNSNICSNGATCRFISGSFGVSGSINSTLVYTATVNVSLQNQPFDSLIYIFGKYNGPMTITVSE